MLPLCPLLSVLLVAFGLALLATYLLAGQANWLLAGNLAMAVMLGFTGRAHFPYERGMALLPAWLPAKKAWVYGTSLLEVAGGMGLLVPALRPAAAGCLWCFSCSSCRAISSRPASTSTTSAAPSAGSGPGYLWFRVPLQGLFLAWAWYFGLHLAA